MQKDIKRVLLTTCYYAPKIGGLETFIKHLSSAQKKRNIETLIVTNSHEPGLLEEEKILDVTVKRLSPDFFWSINNSRTCNFRVVLKLIANINLLFRINRLIKEFKPQIINICYPTPLSAYFAIISYFRRVPIVVSLHGEVAQQLPYLCAMDRFLLKFILRRAAYVTACSRSLLESAIKFAPEIANKSSYIYNGISLEGFLPRENPTIRCNNRYMLTISNLWWYKGIDVLLMAMRLVCEAVSDVDLVIIGYGDQERELCELAGLLKIEDRVVFKGRIDSEEEKKGFLHSCEFFVLPSKIEPFGIVNLEAMAAGKAIVATRIGGIPEIVEDGVNGILVEPCSDKALAEGMMRLLADKELRDRFGRNGRKMVEDPKFSWENVAEKYIGIYRKVLA